MAIDLAFAEQGAGPPLVILHGLFGASSNWASIARRVALRHHVFALDLRNHGASPWAPAMDYEAMAEDVRAFIRRRHLVPAALLGHSMGGKAAMMLALRHAETVERLVVADVAPMAYPPELRGYAEAMRELDLSPLKRRSEADMLLRRRVPDDAVRLFLLQNLVAGPDGLRWRLNLDAILAEMDTIAGFPELSAEAAYRGPALFLRGERSDYVRERDGAAIRRLFPAATIATVPGAGHWIHAERPDAFLAALEPFLASGTGG